MSEHPIEGLMTTAMNSIKDMIDVNTIIGEPIETSNNIVIIPISKVSFGFAAGGSEFTGETIDEYRRANKEEQIQYRLPFGGGSGAGVTINPIAFLVVQEDNVKLMPVSHSSSMDKLLDYMPDLMERANDMFSKLMKKNENSYNYSFKEVNDYENISKKDRNIKNRDNKNKKQLRKPKEETKKTKETIEEETEYEYEYDDTQDD